MNLNYDFPVAFVQVILPIKYRGEITYVVPAQMVSAVEVGSRVAVELGTRSYSAVVEKIFMCSCKKDVEKYENLCELLEKDVVIKEILQVESAKPVMPEIIKFWKQAADYYMCSVGEVYKAAYPSMVVRQEQVKSRKTAATFFASIGEGEDNSVCFPLPNLSEHQLRAYDEILQARSQAGSQARSQARSQAGAQTGSAKPVLLHGVTGSGKTEIYINLAATHIAQGRSVLFMVPEIALTKQLQNRLKKVFGERLLVYHSKQTPAEKNRIHKILSGQYKEEYVLAQKAAVADANTAEAAEVPDVNDAVVVLGTRSSLFLPFRDLGLVVVDEEHDSSYKQADPAPRYHARDAAIMLANIYGASIVLGSATPSFESEYNCRIGRFVKVGLYEKFYGAQEPEIEIIDTIYARKTRQMKGSFSQKLINSMRQVLQNGEQVLVFKNRRSYSPVVECTECGTIPKCPCCNVNLSYHKYNNTLRCHYCDYQVRFAGICTHCGLDTLKYKGAGTEKIEEELTALFPEYRVARFDADIAESKRREEAAIKAFAQKETDILVGTQMISKGFDFEYLGLVVVLDADSLLAIQDFRADEKALQMFNQLMGRTGRRNKQGRFIIQTNQKDHPVIRQLRSGQMSSVMEVSLMEERRAFSFAPYVRMVKVTLKHSDKEKLNELCTRFSAAVASLECKEVTGPFVPAIDKVRGEWLKCYYIKFLRDSRLSANKRKLLEAAMLMKAPNSIILDVDPL